MEKGDATCPKCAAGYRRIELSSVDGERGEFRCAVCNEVPEDRDGSHAVLYRLTAPTSRTLA